MRGVTSDGKRQLSWPTSCETVNIYLNGFTDMTPDEVAKSIGAAAAAWGPGGVTCPASTGDAGSGHPYFEIIPQFASGGSPPFPANDGNNTIVFQTTTEGWSALPVPSNALAYANVSRQPSGDIVDVDIEINATPGMLLGNLDPGSPPPQHGQIPVDLQTLMTHEFGHFLGLAHTCAGDGDSYQPGMGSDNGTQPAANTPDSYGQPIPICTQYPLATEAVQATAVMWYEIDPGVITKRVLTTDDARGVCAIYSPAALRIPACAQNSPDDGCGCEASGQGRGSRRPGPRGARAPGRGAPPSQRPADSGRTALLAHRELTPETKKRVGDL